MARLTLAQIANPDMAGYLQSLGYTYGGETDDGSVRYMNSEGDLVSPENLQDVFSEQGLAEYAANQRRMQGVIDLADYSDPGTMQEYAKKGYASPEAYLSQLYGGGERVGDYFVLPQAGDARTAQMVGTPIVYNSPGLLKEFALGGLGLLAGGYGLEALTASGFGGLGGGAAVGAEAAPVFTGGASGGTITGAASGGGALSGLTAAEMAALGGGGALAAEAGAAGGDIAAQQAIDGSAQTIYDAAAGAGVPTYDPALVSGVGSAATTAGAGTALSRLLDGTATSADYAQLLGTVGGSVLGAVGSNAQADAYSDVANKYLALGAPYRDKLAASYQPGFSMADQPDFQNALDVGAQAAARATSAKVGNPVDNPGAYAEMQKYITGSLALPQLNTYRSQLGSFGQLGTNTAGTNDTQAAGQTSGMYNALGYGLGQLTQPQSLSDNGALSRLLLNSGRFLA